MTTWVFEYSRGYTKHENLSLYINSNIQLLENLPKNNPNHKKYVISHGKPYQEKNDIYFEGYKDATFCSSNMSQNFPKLLEQNGGVQKWELYSGGVFGRDQLNIEEYRSYLEKNNIKCLVLDSYTGKYGETVPMVAIYEHIDKLSFYEFSLFKTLRNLLYYVFINSYWFWLGAFIIIVVYYKLILYIIFGAKKE